MGIHQETLATPRADLGEAFREYTLDENTFIGTRILGLFKTQKKAATFSALTREGMLKTTAGAKRAAKSSYVRTNTEAEDVSYACEEYGLEDALDNGDVALYANDFDAELATTEALYLKLMTALEVRIKTAFFNTSTWTGAALYTDVSSAPWDAAASDIIGHCLAGAEKVRTGTGVKANALVVGAAAFANMLKNTGIKNQFPGAPLITRKMIEDSIASIMGLDYLLVGGAVTDSAKEGQTFVGADVWGDDYAAVCRVAPSGSSLTTPCVGRTMLWESDELVTVEEYEEPQTNSWVYRVRHYTDELIIDPYFSHLLKIDA